MFDFVPARVWLLIAIAAVAYAPARYVYKYLAHSPSRRDITQPAEDLSWRTTSEFARNSVILAALVALAAFIFTPAAAQFAQSPSFLPVLAIGGGAWALFTVLRGLITGQIQPFIRGNYSTYVREAQPKRFWASIAWNAILGFLCLGLAFQMHEQALAQAVEDRCFDERSGYSPQEELLACNKLIADGDKKGDELATLVGARGFAYHQLGDYQHAKIDYTNAIRINPRNPYPHFNRGLIFLDTGKYGEAVADFSRAHELEPKNPQPLANRGITYALKRDQARAEGDFEAVRAVDPSNPVLLRGEALLSMNSGDMKAAVDRFTAALNSDPDNAWSYGMRAEAYWQLGEYEKSRADTRKRLQLSKDANRARPASQ